LVGFQTLVWHAQGKSWTPSQNILSYKLKQGFSNVTSTDISAFFLKKAESKGVYAKTVKHNLLEPFPFSDKAFFIRITDPYS